jgi:hypothetical protein
MLEELAVGQSRNMQYRITRTQGTYLIQKRKCASYRVVIIHKCHHTQAIPVVRVNLVF